MNYGSWGYKCNIHQVITALHRPGSGPPHCTAVNSAIAQISVVQSEMIKLKCIHLYRLLSFMVNAFRERATDLAKLLSSFLGQKIRCHFGSKPIGGGSEKCERPPGSGCTFLPVNGTCRPLPSRWTSMVFHIILTITGFQTDGCARSPESGASCSACVSLWTRTAHMITGLLLRVDAE